MEFFIKGILVPSFTCPTKLQLVDTGELRLRVASYPTPFANSKLQLVSVQLGYSGHETGLAPTWAAVSLGASFVERHITLDRAMWGSDQAASVEPNGFNRLVRNIRDIEIALGDGIKRVYPSEMSARTKLRRVK